MKTMRAGYFRARRTFIPAAVAVLVAVMLAACFGSDFSLRSIGGTVSGPVTGGVELQLQVSSGTETLLISENTSFVFSRQGVVGKPYEVTVQAHPEESFCVLSNANGTVSRHSVDNIHVNCSLFELDARPDFGLITLDWHFDSPVDIRYSTDPHCDWDNYMKCPDGKMLTNVQRGLTLGPDDGVIPDKGYYFVMEADGMRSEVVAASAWSASVNGDVNSVLVHEGRWYLGGDFTYAAPRTGPGVLLDAQDGRLRGVLQVVERGSSVDDPPAEIRAVVADDNGGWFVGGRFQSIGGVMRERLARIQADGSLDTDWSSGWGGVVSSLAYANGTLYVGGSSGLAAVDAETGELLSWHPNSGGYNSVSSLFAVDGVVYAGGFFLDDIWSPTWGDYFVAIDARSGDYITWPSGMGADREVLTMAHVDGVIYVGGRFTQFLGQPRERLAAFDATSGALLDWNPGADKVVSALAYQGGTLYAGGSFEQINGESRHHIAAFDIASGELTAWNPGANAFVSALDVANEVLYAGGGFTEIGNQERKHLAAFDAGGDLLEWAPETDGSIAEIAAAGSRVYAGGDFTHANIRARQYLAAFDTATGGLSDWNPGADHPVSTMKVDDNRIIAATSYEDEEGGVYAQLAAFDAETGEPHAWNPPQLSGGMVHAMQRIDDRLYVGGAFSHVAHFSRTTLAAFDAFSGNLLAWSPAVEHNLDWPEPPDPVVPVVYALAYDGGNLYVGGNFTSVEGETHLRVASVDPETGVPEDWDLWVSGVVQSMTIGNGKLYTAGPSTNAMRAYDIENREMLDWDTGGLRGDVLSLVYGQGWIYAGGTFTESWTVGERVCDEFRCEFVHEPRPHLAAFHEDTGELAEWNPVANDDVHGLAFEDGRIYAGGRFIRIGGDAPPDGQSRGHLTTIDADTVPFVQD